MSAQKEDHWTSEAYQNAASFVPKLATKVLGWLDAKEDDLILDVGCGDGVLNLQIGHTLATGKGKIHGIDSSPEMIISARKAASSDPLASTVCSFEVMDATHLLLQRDQHTSHYDKVFSNAAMHWILRPPSHREDFFHGVRHALKPNGVFVFEMGGMGNVAEMHSTFLSVVGRRLGMKKAREVDPWFFPDENWMKNMLEERVRGWKVERIEREYRPTRADEGGIEGWVRLMGKQFFNAVNEGKEREECIRESCEVLKTVCASPGGGDWIGYVRLRVLARKV